MTSVGERELGAPFPTTAFEETSLSEHHAPAVCLVVSLFLFGVTRITSPEAGLDPSWRTGTNIASASGLHFGRDIIFTYGPLGFLATAQSLSVTQMMLSLAFSLVATASLWAVLYFGVARTTHHLIAGVISIVMVGVISEASILSSSLMILISASIITLWFMKGNGSGHLRWTPPAVSAVAAILLQLKFSEGAVLIAIAVIGTLFSPSQTLWRVVQSALAFWVTFVTTWLLAGQSLGDIPSWLSGSTNIALGFSEAMAYEIPPILLSYLVAIVLAMAVMVLTMRWAATGTRRARLGILLVVLCLLVFSFKQGFTRHDEHERAFFAVTAALFAALLASTKRQSAVMGLLAVSLVFSSATWSRFDPLVARDAWKTNVELLMYPEYRQFSLVQAANALKTSYALPPAIVAMTKERPVSIDPWEATMAWAYGVNWRPVPVFQSYVAYTATLDQINADAIVSAPRNQVVIRARPESIDGRNPMWETPRYLLSLACNYEAGPSDDRWMSLEKADPRCSAPSEKAAMRLEAGVRFTLPRAQPGEILVGHFTPDAQGLSSTVLSLLTKESPPLIVNANGVGYRLPKRLADGPLLLRFPESLGWPDLFGGKLAYKTLAFSQPGRLTLETVTVMR